jgi:hypothetical protein
MKNYFLLALCVSLLFVGCEKDDGFRAVSIEVELGAVQVSVSPDTSDINNIELGVYLSSEDPDTELSLYEYYDTYNGAVPKKVFTSEDVIWAVGTNVRREIYSNGSLDADYDKLPCDVTIRIKADNKVIWSYSAKKGDDEFVEVANLIIR